MSVRPHRLAVISRNFGDVGGAEHFAARLAEGVADQPDFEVHVFTSRFYQGHPAIHVHQLAQPKGPRFLQKPLFSFWAHRAVAQHSPFDLIHTHEPFSGAQIITYGTPHDFWVRQVRKKKWNGLNDFLTVRLEKTMLEHPDTQAILPMSVTVRETLKNYYPHLAPKLQVLEPGIEVERFGQSLEPEQRKEHRMRYGVMELDSVALFIGNNYHHKGLSEILIGLSQTPVKPNGGIVKLWVLGRGDIPHYHQMAKQLGLGDRVVFGGIIRTGLESWLQAADFLVLLSAFETFGMVVLEGMAAGLPALVSDQVGAKEMIVPGKNGWIIPYGSSPETIKQALVEASLTCDQKEISRYAQETAAKCSWQASHRKLLEIYRKCLSNKLLLVPS